MIRVENLVRKFGELTAVDHISFQVNKGEMFAFLGPNGAGKTTTIKMLTTLLRPTSGSVQVDGLNPEDHAREVRKRIGIVFQDPSLDGDMTALENMEVHAVFYHVPRKIRAERIESLLRGFELWERRNDRVKLFSGGMKRRLEIARGLLHTPRIPQNHHEARSADLRCRRSSNRSYRAGAFRPGSRLDCPCRGRDSLAVCRKLPVLED